MHRDEFMTLLTSMSAAADLVDAIDRPALQLSRGWDLAGWKYELIPWGVRFLPPGGKRERGIKMVAVKR
jgi:hypothetical protein